MNPRLLLLSSRFCVPLSPLCPFLLILSRRLSLTCLAGMKRIAPVEAVRLAAPTKEGRGIFTVTFSAPPPVFVPLEAMPLGLCAVSLSVNLPLQQASPAGPAAAAAAGPAAAAAAAAAAVPLVLRGKLRQPETETGREKLLSRSLYGAQCMHPCAT